MLFEETLSSTVKCMEESKKHNSEKGKKNVNFLIRILQRIENSHKIRARVKRRNQKKWEGGT